MINFLHTFHPSPILISIGPVNIYWYGFFIVLGIFAAMAVIIKLSSYYPESRINKEIIIDLAFWLVLAGLVGARLYHVFLELSYYLDNPLDVFKIWQGGLAIHGGIIAGIIVIWFFAKKITPLLAKPACPVGREGQGGGLTIGAINHETSPNLSLVRRENNFWFLSALLAPGLALAQVIGRWGNYFNQELFGGPTNLPWGIPIDIFNRPLEYASYEFFHPTFLYESIGNFLIFLILIFIHIWIIKNKRQKIPTSYKLQATSYRLCVMSYLILYSLLRFFLEFIRIDDTPTFLGLRWPQIMSILIIIASTVILLKNKKNHDNIK
jgi:phosphatidylglycerol:prolipoprotein diacylglycerol transferase